MTQYYQCEGRFCEQANEMYYEEYPEEAERMPEFIYNMSPKLMMMEAKIDARIELLEQFNVLAGLMLLRSTFFWGEDPIEVLRDHVYKVIGDEISSMHLKRFQTMYLEGGLITEVFNVVELRINKKINEEWQKIKKQKKAQKVAFY
ncbi:hypothetical protein D3C87_1376200 [compost metagenome]